MSLACHLTAGSQLQIGPSSIICGGTQIGSNPSQPVQVTTTNAFNATIRIIDVTANVILQDARLFSDDPFAVENSVLSIAYSGMVLIEATDPAHAAISCELGSRITFQALPDSAAVLNARGGPAAIGPVLGQCAGLTFVNGSYSLFASTGPAIGAAGLGSLDSISIARGSYQVTGTGGIQGGNVSLKSTEDGSPIMLDCWVNGPVCLSGSTIAVNDVRVTGYTNTTKFLDQDLDETIDTDLDIFYIQFRGPSVAQTGLTGAGALHIGSLTLPPGTHSLEIIYGRFSLTTSFEVGTCQGFVVFIPQQRTAAPVRIVVDGGNMICSDDATETFPVYFGELFVDHAGVCPPPPPTITQSPDPTATALPVTCRLDGSVTYLSVSSSGINCGSSRISTDPATRVLVESDPFYSGASISVSSSVADFVFTGLRAAWVTALNSNVKIAFAGPNVVASGVHCAGSNITFEGINDGTLNVTGGAAGIGGNCDTLTFMGGIYNVAASDGPAIGSGVKRITIQRGDFRLTGTLALGSQDTGLVEFRSPFDGDIVNLDCWVNGPVTIAAAALAVRDVKLTGFTNASQFLNQDLNDTVDQFEDVGYIQFRGPSVRQPGLMGARALHIADVTLPPGHHTLSFQAPQQTIIVPFNSTSRGFMLLVPPGRTIPTIRIRVDDDQFLCDNDGIEAFPLFAGEEFIEHVGLCPGATETRARTPPPTATIVSLQCDLSSTNVVIDQTGIRWGGFLRSENPHAVVEILTHTRPATGVIQVNNVDGVNLLFRSVTMTSQRPIVATNSNVSLVFTGGNVITGTTAAIVTDSSNLTLRGAVTISGNVVGIGAPEGAGGVVTFLDGAYTISATSGPAVGASGSATLGGILIQRGNFTLTGTIGLGSIDPTRTGFVSITSPIDGAEVRLDFWVGGDVCLAAQSLTITNVHLTGVTNSTMFVNQELDETIDPINDLCFIQFRGPSQAQTGLTGAASLHFGTLLLPPGHHTLEFQMARLYIQVVFDPGMTGILLLMPRQRTSTSTRIRVDGDQFLCEEGGLETFFLFQGEFYVPRVGLCPGPTAAPTPPHVFTGSPETAVSVFTDTRGNETDWPEQEDDSKLSAGEVAGVVVAVVVAVAALGACLILKVIPALRQRAAEKSALTKD